MPTITYYASNGTMGDTTPADCDAFRTWAFQQIAAEYPGFDVEVLPDDAGCQVKITGDIPDDFGRIEIDDLEAFVARLWDQCPWDWKE